MNPEADEFFIKLAEEFAKEGVVERIEDELTRERTRYHGVVHFNDDISLYFSYAGELEGILADLSVQLRRAHKEKQKEKK